MAQERLALPPLLARLRPLLLAQEIPVYLVGGAVRDALLGRISYDLDFVAPEQAIALAFRVGDALEAPAFVLDRERDIARVVLAGEADLDFARFRGDDLEADLRARDFTINAMALPVAASRPSEIVDPCQGRADLARGLIRLAYSQALHDDPVRAMRAARLALQLGFRLAPETAEAVQAAAPRLQAVSIERTRDELLKALESPRAHEALPLLQQLRLLPQVLPEIADLEGVQQSAPHHEGVLAHTASVLKWLRRVEGVLLDGEEEAARVPAEAVARLARFAPGLNKHFARRVDGGLEGRLLLRLGALFHDVGKAETQTVEAEGRIRFLGHEKVGAKLAARRLHRLRLSNQAVQHVRDIVQGHMRPLWLAQEDKVSRRAVYRFFGALGDAGLDVGMLSVADHLATHGGAAHDAGWERLLAVVERLYAYYFEAYEQVVSPPPLVRGGELIAALSLTPGPEVGELLRVIEEAQAAGEIATAEEAIALAERHRAGQQ